MAPADLGLCLPAILKCADHVSVAMNNHVSVAINNHVSVVINGHLSVVINSHASVATITGSFLGGVVQAMNADRQV